MGGDQTSQDLSLPPSQPFREGKVFRGLTTPPSTAPEGRKFDLCTQYIVAAITKHHNCIWENVEITAKNCLLIQLIGTVQILCY